MQIIHGLGPVSRHDAAMVYWEAFGPKLRRILGPDDRAVGYVTRILRPTHVLTAISDQGDLLGLAGFHDHLGSFVGGGFGDLLRDYGILGGGLRAAAFRMLTQDADNDRFLMDGLCVAEHARGRGVGSALLTAIGAVAEARGFREIRLDVVDNNLRARALYERRGFQPVAQQTLGPLRHLFGFRSATTMVQTIS